MERSMTNSREGKWMAVSEEMREAEALGKE